MSGVDRVNTIKVEFSNTTFAQPTNHELIVFALGLELKQQDINCLYYDTIEKCVYLKVHTPSVKNEVLVKYSKTLFHYNSGITTQVYLSTASYRRSAVHHLQVFNLPPEVDNGSVREAFEEFGIVEHVEREKIEMPLQFNVLNGVRRIRVNIKKTIPPVMWIQGYPVTVGFWSPKSEVASQPEVVMDEGAVTRRKVNRPRSAPALDCIPEDEGTKSEVQKEEKKKEVVAGKPKKSANFKDFYSQKAKN
jgi:hypothetical protein